jgi:hypothetical protein
MLDQHEVFYLRQRGLELEIRARRRAGEKIEFASKKTLQKVITEKFLAAFEQQGIEVGHDFPKSVGFTIKCAGWLLLTNFEFGSRQESFIEYKHLIVGKVGGVNPDGTIFWPAPWLATFCWIGGQGMAELIALYIVCNKIGVLARSRGVVAKPYQVRAVLLWIVFEFVAAFLASVIGLEGIFVYLAAFAGALLSVHFAFNVVRAAVPAGGAIPGSSARNAAAQRQVPLDF